MRRLSTIVTVSILNRAENWGGFTYESAEQVEPLLAVFARFERHVFEPHVGPIFGSIKLRTLVHRCYVFTSSCSKNFEDI